MDRLFLTVLNMSLTGAFVIAAICLARPLLKKAPKIISYCLWAVAGFRLMFPFSIESVLSLIPFKAQTIPPDIAMQPIPRIDSGISFINNAVSGILPAAAPTASANPLQVWAAIGAFIWLTGAIIMLFYGVASFIILKRQMKEAKHIETNIYEAKNIKSPFVLGVFKPMIYLPFGLSAQEKNYIILHEQTHIKRRDHIVKFVSYFALCLHWFNAFVWAAFLLMGVDMEMSCDERVLKETGGETKKDYSLSLLSLATDKRIIGGSPLAFGEGGVKERIKNILNFKKPSRVIIIAAVALAAVLSVGFAVDRTIAYDKSFPMQGANLSDLQPDEIIRQIVQITGAKSDSIIVPGRDNFTIQVAGDFDWQLSGAISMYVSKNKTNAGSLYSSQLRIFPDELNYFVTEPQRQEPPERQYYLRDYLNALKYLPQEHIRSLTMDNPDGYIINFIGDGMPGDNQPCVYYDMNGMTENNNNWTIRLDIQPLYQDEDGAGYHGVGSDVIHVFYGGLSGSYGQPVALTAAEKLDKIYLGMTSAKVYELFGEPDYQGSGLYFFGYNDVGSFYFSGNFYAESGLQSHDIATQINMTDRSYDINEFVSTAVKQRNANASNGEFAVESHINLAIDADPNGFTIYVISLYETFMPDGEYNVKLVDSTHALLVLTFAKTAKGNYELKEYRPLEYNDYYTPSMYSKIPKEALDRVSAGLYLEQLKQNCYDDAMYSFTGAIPFDGGYGMGMGTIGTVALTRVADSSTEKGYFTIKYFPGATLQIEAYHEEPATNKPGSFIIEYTDKFKNITVGNNGTDIIAITDDLIGIFNVAENEYAMKFEKYVKPK